jgi:hypothetical protein
MEIEEPTLLRAVGNGGMIIGIQLMGIYGDIT